MASNFTKRTLRLKTERTLTGTVSVPLASTAVTGIGTLFTTELVVNDYIWIGGELCQVDAITNNLALVLKSVSIGLAAGVVIKRTSKPLYTTPVSTLSIIHSLFISNVNDFDYKKFIMRIFDNTTGEWIVMANKLEVPLENTYSHPKPINLEASDKFHLTAIDGPDFEMHVYASIVEKTL